MRRFATSSMLMAAAMRRLASTLGYTDSHEWIKQGDGEVTIGVSNYAQQNLGDVVFVSLPQVGDKVTAKNVVAEVESVKATSNVYSPVDGTVNAVNESLKDKPDLINKSPESDGWIVKVKCSEMPKGLMTDKEYQKFLEEDTFRQTL